MANIENMDSLLRKLAQIADINNATMKGLEKAAIRVEVDAKVNAPSDDGHLRASLTHELDGSKLQAAIGSNLHYAPYVEFGTGVHAVKGDGRKTPWSYEDAEGNWHTTAGQHPQPFLEPALDMNKDAIQKDIANEVKKYIGGIGTK